MSADLERGIRMGFGDFAKGVMKQMTKIGTVSGADFPLGTIINFSSADGDSAMLFTYPNKEEYVVTHEKVKSASVLAMGVIEIEKNGNNTTLVYGTKYRVELNDGKVAILTVGLGNTLYKIEHIIF